MISRAISLIIGYFCGCILTADIVAKNLTGRSAFDIGSHNPGMANIAKQLGKKAGAVVLAGDIFKTAIAMLAAWLLFGKTIGVPAAMWAGLGALLGHNYPFWHHFQGGKGVAVSCTMIFLLMPLWGAVSCIAGLLVVILSKSLHVGAVAIPAFALLFACIFYDQSYIVLMTFTLVMMIIRNRHDLKRLFSKESK